jgi:hypothetical protein
MNIHHIALITGLFLSGVAAYYSVIGLAAIFAAAFLPVVIMGGALEVAKVVATSWLFRNWRTAPRFIKAYLMFAVLVLMLLTSMGIFGFLSKAHIDQTLASGTSGAELKVIEQQIQYEQRRIENANKSLSTLDRLVDQATPETANSLRERQGRERRSISTEINAANTAIKDLNSKALPLRRENLQSTADVGPIKFIAARIYGETDENVLERAVGWVILLIIFAFDPLALALLIAANHGLRKVDVNETDNSWLDRASMWIKRRKDGTIEIDQDSIHFMK